ncbi:MAG: LCP family protein [Chloroflexi bacterium]|nr:LCP family protein [Chloroflexota bacterium]MBP8054492.1 LCP family protein [Chloroflexota bacterium]
MTEKQSSNRRSHATIRLPLWGVVILVLVIFLVLVGSAAWLYRTVEAIASDSEVFEPVFTAPTGGTSQPDPAIISSDDTADAEAVVQPFISENAFQPWAGPERVNILLLGIDQRCDETGPTRTDSMMVVTIDPVGHSAAALSIPRDLWVEVPGFGVDRINSAHYTGEINEYPGGGPALAAETVAATLGVPIDYYVTVNFDGFVEVVDLIGGITITVPEAIEDLKYPDRCYGYDPFHIEAGTHQLDGQTALKYARTRATFGGDVDRAGRQQEVVLAVRDKVLSLDMLPQLLGQSLELWQTFQDNVETNLTLDQVIQLALLVQEIPRESIQTAVIDYSYVFNETTPDGQQVLVPNRDRIRQLRDQLFAPPAIPTPVIENLPERAAEEAARVAIYNGTSEFGLAAATQEYLESHNISVTTIGNADAATYRTTQIIDFGTHPFTTRYLTQLMAIPPLNVSTGTNPDGDYDVLIIIGDDWDVP